MELGLQKLLECFLVHLFGGGDFLSSGLIDHELRLGFRVSDKEDTIRLSEAAGVAIENVASILAVILV